MKITSFSFKNTAGFKNISAATSFAKSLKNNNLALWKARLGSQVTTTPCIAADGTIYVASLEERQSGEFINPEGKLVALDDKGNIKWAYKTPKPVYSSPSLDKDGNIYFGCQDGNLYAVTSAGELKWKFPAGDFIETKPVINDKGIIFGCQNHNLYSIDFNGNIRSKFSADSFIAKKLLGLDDGSVVFYSPCSLYRVSGDGILLWKYEKDSSHYIVDFCISEDKKNIYVSTSDRSLILLDLSGREISKKEFPRLSSPPSHMEKGNKISPRKDGGVYTSDGSDYLYLLKEDCSVGWQYKIGESTFCSPLIDSGGNVVIGNDEGWVFSVDSSGKLNWKYKADGMIYAPPKVTDEGIAIVPTNGGSLYALGRPGIKEVLKRENFDRQHNDRKHEIKKREGFVDIGDVTVPVNKRYK